MSGIIDNKEVKAARLSRIEGTEISRSKYNLILGLTLLWGIFINCIMASPILNETILSMNYIAVIVIYFVGSLACMGIVYASKNPIVSFLGFTGLSIAMGLLLTFYVSYFSLGEIFSAFIATAITVAVMVLAGTLYPNFFFKIRNVLFLSLLVVIIVEIIFMLIGFSNGITDWIVVLIFCGWVGYDWAKSQAFPSTVDNAIDSAADIYIDIANLFVRLLEIIGRKK